MGPKFKGIAKGRAVQSGAALKEQVQINEAVALHQQGRLGEAKAVYESP